MYSEKEGSVSDVADSISVPSPSAKAFILGPAQAFEEPKSNSTNSEKEN